MGGPCNLCPPAGFLEVTSHNPYWDREGRTYRTFEAYRLVLQ